MSMQPDLIEDEVTIEPLYPWQELTLPEIMGNELNKATDVDLLREYWKAEKEVKNRKSVLDAIEKKVKDLDKKD